MLIGGITPLSTLDFPGELAAVLFCQGCPWNCQYCQNTHLIPPRGDRTVPWLDAERFLLSRVGLLDAAVFSGGEPTTQSGLEPAMQRVHELGLKVGLHTAGASVRRFEAILDHCDWIGLDIKALPEDYEFLTGAPRSGVAAWDCLQLLARSGLPYEVRTTLHSHLTSRESLLEMAERLADLGVRSWALQTCRTHQGNARNLPPNRWPDGSILAFIDSNLRPLFEDLVLRAS